MMFIAAALIGSVVTFGENMAFATKKHNDAELEIEQEQENEQNAQCVSGDFSLLCGNNLGFMFQDNDGNLALAQR